jgi:hypothetical protein
MYLAASRGMQRSSDATGMRNSPGSCCLVCLPAYNVVHFCHPPTAGWMKSPIPANRLTPEALGCGKPGGAYGTGKPGAVRAQSSTPSSSPKPSPSPSPKPSLPVAAPGGACGPAVGARCPINQCCSQYGYCGITAQHCGAGCQKTYGQCNK